MTPQQWQQAGQYFSFNGQQIFYRDSGDTGNRDLPALLLIHGFPTASWDWHPLWQALSTEFRLIAADMLGFGFSDKPKKHEYSIHEQADIQAQLLAHLGIRQSHALVHDYGVSVMQELLARQHEGAQQTQFISACFLNGGLFPEQHRARFIQKAMLSPFGPLLSLVNNQRQFNRSFSAVFGPNTKPDQIMLNACWEIIKQQQGQRILHRLMRYMHDRVQHRQRWSDAIKQPHIPVRLINGPEDPVSGKHLLDYYCQQVANADVISLSGIGHYPQLEAPEQVLKNYLEFVRPLL